VVPPLRLYTYHNGSKDQWPGSNAGVTLVRRAERYTRADITGRGSDLPNQVSNDTFRSTGPLPHVEAQPSLRQSLGIPDLITRCLHQAIYLASGKCLFWHGTEPDKIEG
jgi:hypothetical protein